MVTPLRQRPVTIVRTRKDLIIPNRSPAPSVPPVGGPLGEGWQQDAPDAFSWNAPTTEQFPALSLGPIQQGSNYTIQFAISDFVATTGQLVMRVGWTLQNAMAITADGPYQWSGKAGTERDDIWFIIDQNIDVTSVAIRDLRVFGPGLTGGTIGTTP